MRLAIGRSVIVDGSRLRSLYAFVMEVSRSIDHMEASSAAFLPVLTFRMSSSNVLSAANECIKFDRPNELCIYKKRSVVLAVVELSRNATGTWNYFGTIIAVLVLA